MPSAKVGLDDIRRLRHYDDKDRQAGMKTPLNIGRAEMEILRYVADHHPVTVREVAGHLAETKGHVRTTALNIMERLRKKGYLTRRRIAGVFHYAPKQSKTELLRTLVRDFVHRALGGSVSPFVAYLTQEAKLTEDELDELKQLVSELEKDQKRQRS